MLYNAVNLLVMLIQSVNPKKLFIILCEGLASQIESSCRKGMPTVGV